jgi:hypothetical protein
MLYKGNKWAAYCSLGPVKNVCCTRHKILRTPMCCRINMQINNIKTDGASIRMIKDKIFYFKFVNYLNHTNLTKLLIPMTLPQHTFAFINYETTNSIFDYNTFKLLYNVVFKKNMQSLGGGMNWK